MNSTREIKSSAAQNTLLLAVRLRDFMHRWRLTREEMAGVLKTPPRTLDGWLDFGKTPPACLAPLLDLLEERSQVRTWLGVHAIWRKGEPRGRPFRRGNEYRFNDKRRPEALARARAI
jgi:hypothetical protein